MAHQALHLNSTSPTPALDAIVKTSRLRRNAQGFWQIHYSEPADDGRWRSKTLSTRTQDFAAAQSALTDWLTGAQAQRTKDTTGHVTVGVCIERYLETRSVDVARHARSILRMPGELLGHMLPCDLNQQVVNDYCRARINLKLDGAPVKSGTLRRELSSMLTAINYMVDQRIISSTDGPAKLKLPDNSPPRLRYLNHDEMHEFWDAAQARGGQLALFVAIGLDTAARRGAILGLTWDRVDLRNHFIDFRDPKVRVSRKRRVMVPISERLLVVLEKARAETTGHGRLFDSKLRTTWGTFTRSLGKEWVTAHVMRHTWASLAAIDGAPLYHIAKMLGDTIATIEKTYAHLAPDHLRDIVNRRWVSKEQGRA